MPGQIIKKGPKKYLVRVYLGEVDGKRKYLNKTIHGNKDNARQYVNKIIYERDIGTYTAPSKELLSSYLDTWAETALKARVRERTYLDYMDRLRLYVKPEIGHLRLHKITPENIQALYNKMLEKGLSSRSVRYTHTILKNALDQAVKWGKLYRNPCALVDLPRQKKEEMKTLTPAQAVKFIEAAAESPWKALFTLLLASGMRPSEALALKWSDIDFEKKRVTVNRSLTRPRGGGWRLQELKTSGSRRTVPLPATVINDLREHKNNQKIVKLDGFVFSAKGGEPAHEGNISRRHFKPLLREAGLPDIRLYDLRHTCATLLLAAGENPKVVSERLGHAGITLTLDTYSHVLPDMQDRATAKLEKMLFND
ncbi:MAG: site-specific integrase [Bacillota bacterium]|nr:site-specific integrase [Bacillota bacterium]